MHNIFVIPHEGSQTFKFEACPDTGCTKTIIARNLKIRQGMRFNPDSALKIRAVNAQRLYNSGSVTFTLGYQGQSTEVNALVLDAVKDEILLSWRVLKNLGVINSTFPTVRAAKTMSTGSFAHIETDTEAKLEVSNLMGEYKQVFQINGRLQTMKGEPLQIHMKKNANVTVMNVCARSNRALADIPGVFKLVDDILVHGESCGELFERIKTVFARCH